LNHRGSRLPRSSVRTLPRSSAGSPVSACPRSRAGSSASSLPGSMVGYPASSPVGSPASSLPGSSAGYGASSSPGSLARPLPSSLPGSSAGALPDCSPSSPASSPAGSWASCLPRSLPGALTRPSSCSVEMLTQGPLKKAHAVILSAAKNLRDVCFAEPGRPFISFRVTSAGFLNRPTYPQFLIRVTSRACREAPVPRRFGFRSPADAGKPRGLIRGRLRPCRNRRG